jgi:hypothetical protein
MLKLTAIPTVLNVFFFGFGYARERQRCRRAAPTAGHDDREHGRRGWHGRRVEQRRVF